MHAVAARRPEWDHSALVAAMPRAIWAHLATSFIWYRWAGTALVDAHLRAPLAGQPDQFDVGAVREEHRIELGRRGPVVIAGGRVHQAGQVRVADRNPHAVTGEAATPSRLRATRVG